MATLGEANVGGRMVPAWLLNMTAEELDNLRTAVCRRNLLGNAYFKGGGSQQGGGQFPINQRGQTSYTAGANFVNGGIDRWRTSNTNITINGDSINISSGTFSEAYSRFTQMTEKTLVSGKTYTMSMLAKINSIIRDVIFRVCNSTHSGIGAQTSLSQTDGFSLISFTLVPDSDVENYGVEILGGTIGESRFDIDLKAIKLEEGPTQTLAYQDEDGNWQLFETPDYGEELAKCQRYLLQLGSTGVSRVAVGYCTTASQIIVPIPIPTTMRINLPTVQYSALSDLTLHVNGTTIIIPTEVSVNFSSANTIDLIFTVSGATPGNAAILRILSNGFLRISAEL